MKFKADDFPCGRTAECLYSDKGDLEHVAGTCQAIANAERANAKLKEWFADLKTCGPFLAIVEEQIREDERVKMLKGAVEVFKCGGMGHYDKWIENYSELDTVPSHSAQLINVREIK